MNFAPMKNSIEMMKKSAERYSKALAKFRSATRWRRFSFLIGHCERRSARRLASVP